VPVPVAALLVAPFGAPVVALFVALLLAVVLAAPEVPEVLAAATPW
jgi:hypothetical protein